VSCEPKNVLGAVEAIAEDLRFLCARLRMGLARKEGPLPALGTWKWIKDDIGSLQRVVDHTDAGAETARTLFAVGLIDDAEGRGEYEVR